MRIAYSLLFLSLLSPHVFANDYCSLNNTPLKKRIKLANDPNYFISSDPTGRFTAVIDESLDNILVDMESGKVHRVPGGVDPVFTPDNKFLTLPDGAFIEMREIDDSIRRGRSPRNISPAIRADQDGVYQSIGILPGATNSKKTYRYMNDNAGASFFDVEVQFDNNGKMTRSKVKDDQRRMCNEASNRDTPMLSKDGKYLSILNFETHTTQIWRVNDDGSCKMMVDVGVPTGKVDFGFDPENPQITFHVDEVYNDWHYFSGIDGEQRKSVYVMNLNKSGSGNNESWSVESMAKVVPPGTTEMSTGSYYPRFRKDGTVVMVTNDDSGDYFLDVIDSKDLDFQDHNPEHSSGRILAEPSCSLDERKAFNSQVALGWLWADICSDYSKRLRTSEMMLIPLGMDRNKCEELVRKKWLERRTSFDSFKAIPRRSAYNSAWTEPRATDVKEIHSLSIEDLISACPDGVGQEDNGVQVIATDGEASGPLPVEKIVSRNCIGCHETGVQVSENGILRNESNGPFIDFNNIGPEDATAWISRIFNPRPRSAAMPPPKDLDGDGKISEAEFQKSLNDSFSEEQQKTLREKLNAIEQGTHDWQWNSAP